MFHRLLIAILNLHDEVRNCVTAQKENVTNFRLKSYNLPKNRHVRSGYLEPVAKFNVHKDAMVGIFHSAELESWSNDGYSYKCLVALQ